MVGVIFAAALTGQACWNIYDAAMRHRAELPHPAYVRYDERSTVVEDGLPIVRADAAIAFREEGGLARVDDDRFSGYTFVTDHVEPGPPELGPYGSQRSAWLPDLRLAFPLIGSVHAHGARACTNDGKERYRDHDTYHLVLTPYDTSHPALKELWIDAQSNEIWKIIVSGPLFLTSGYDAGESPLVDFAVETSQAGPYVMVDHVSWQYRMPVYSQYSNLYGDYYFHDFAYPVSEPSSVFAIDRH